MEEPARCEVAGWKKINRENREPTDQRQKMYDEQTHDARHGTKPKRPLDIDIATPTKAPSTIISHSLASHATAPFTIHSFIRPFISSRQCSTLFVFARLCLCNQL